MAALVVGGPYGRDGSGRYPAPASVGGHRLRAERDGYFDPATDTAVETFQKRAFTPALLVIVPQQNGMGGRDHE
jgi:peptidoglycan hydrolase-like protein with peptidoglycan-binding domain